MGVNFGVKKSAKKRHRGMKFGFRKPSLKKRITARTSWKRYARHSLGFKAPRGWGWFTNPRRAAYNRVYNRTTFGLGKGCLVIFALHAAFFSVITIIAQLIVVR